MASKAEQMAANISLSKFGKATELKQRLWFTLGALIVFRLLSFVPLPGIDPVALAALYANNAQGGVLDIFNTFSGGSLQRMSLIALGVMPYITASIVVQLAASLSPSLAAIKKEGEAGRKKLNQYTRYGTVFLTAMQGYFLAAGLETLAASSGMQAVVEPGFGLIEGDDQDQDPNQYQDHNRDGDGGEDQDQGYKYEHEPEHERDWEQDWKREEEAAAQQSLADEVAAVTATDSADGAEASATAHEDKEQHDNLYHHDEGDEETLDSSTVATELSDLESKTSSGTKVVLASPLMKERPPEAKSEKEDKGNKVDKKGKMPNISALQRFHQTQAEESGQSAFQKGKKKVARVSRFRLYNEVPGDMFSSSQREEILAESGKTERNIAEMSDAQRRVACLEQIHGNLDMASWQLFSIKSCVDNNDGPKVTLPELGSRALSVLDVKQRKGRYGSRLVYLQGKNEGVFEKAPSYLDVSHRK